VLAHLVVGDRQPANLLAAEARARLHRTFAPRTLRRVPFIAYALLAIAPSGTAVGDYFTAVVVFNGIRSVNAGL
jgi:hypothetical protein